MDFSLAKLAKYRQVIGIAVAALVLTVIFVPFQKASAYTLSTTLPDASNNTSTQSVLGEKFTVSIDIQPGELIAISSIDALVDNGQPSVAKTTFTVSGTTAQYSSGDHDMIKGNLTLTVPSSSQYGYAYGYGLASNGITGPTGYSYAISYSNAFIGGNTGGYANAVGNNLLGFVGPGTITITGYVNTALLSAGSHTLDIVVNTGAGVNPSQLVSPTLTFTVNANGDITTASVSSGTDSTTSFNASDGHLITVKLDNVFGSGQILTQSVTPSFLAAHYPNAFSAIDGIAATFSVGTSAVHTAGTIYDLDTIEISFGGFAYVTISYDPDLLPSGSTPRFYHYNGVGWEDLTYSVDTTLHTVTGKLTSLSPVVAGYVSSTSSSTTTTTIGGNGGGGSVIINQTLDPSYFENNPLAKLQIKSSSIQDLLGNTLVSAKAGQQVSISATYHNYQQVSQDYAMIIQIVDQDGFTTDLSWATGTVDSGKNVDGSRSWTVEEPGSYTVKIFVWNGVSNSPIALSQVTSNYFSASQ